MSSLLAGLFLLLLLLAVGIAATHIAKRYQAGWKGWLASFSIALVALIVGFLVGNKSAEALFVPPNNETPGTWESVPLPDGQQPDSFVIPEKQSPAAHIVVKSGLTMHNACYSDLEHASWIVGEAGYNHHGSCDLGGPSWAGMAEMAEATGAPGEVTQRLYCCHTTGGGEGDACLYVILENGQVWRWRKPLHGELLVELQKALSMFLWGAVGAIGGGVLGILTSILVLRNAGIPRR